MSEDVPTGEGVPLERMNLPALLAGLPKGGWDGWKPSSSSNFSNRAFRARIYKLYSFEFPLVETRQTVPCRAIRGNSISVNSTLPPLSCTHLLDCLLPFPPRFSYGERHEWIQSCRGTGGRPSSVESPRGIFPAAAQHYRTRTLSKRLPKAKRKPLRPARRRDCGGFGGDHRPPGWEQEHARGRAASGRPRLLHGRPHCVAGGHSGKPRAP